MTTPLSSRSSWIDSIAYAHGKDDEAWVAVFFSNGTAALYKGVPSNLPGRIVAGRVKTVDGKRLSVGAAYHRFLRGRYVSQTITDAGEVAELKRIMKEGIV